MKYLSILALLLVLLIEDSFAQTDTDDANIDVTATIESDPGTCDLTAGNPLAFGNLQRPSTGSAGAIAYSSTVDGGGTPTFSGGLIDAQGTKTIGTMSVNPQNTSSVTVTVDFPTEIASGTGPSAPEITFENGNWAHTVAATGGPWTANPDLSWTETITSHNLTIRFQFGGTLSGISNTQDEGSYSGTISVSSSCPE